MTERFEAADYLDSPESVAAYLTEALDTNDPAFIGVAFETVARAKEFAGATKSNSLNQHEKPDLETIRKALDAFGVRLVVAPVNAA